MKRFISMSLKIWFGLLFTGIFSIMLYMLFNWPWRVAVPNRPSNIPDSAIWVGGIDGGDWINCIEMPDLQNTFMCTIYEDSHGELVYKGLFQYQNKDKIIALKELKARIQYFNGEIIRLDSNEELYKIISEDQNK